MTTSPPTDRDRPRTPDRPPLVAMVVVGILGVVVLGLFLYSGGLGTESLTASLLDEGEAIVEPGEVTFDLGPVAVRGTLAERWIRRERCPGWIQLNSLGGDATTIHLVATTGAPDLATGSLVDVEDYPAWLDRDAGITMPQATDTTLLGAPAVVGRLRARDGADPAALVVACREEDGSGGSGIRGPAAGFEQVLVATTAPVDGLGSVLVLGAAWVGGDIDLATDEARGLADSLVVVDQ